MGYEGHTEINPELILCTTFLLIWDNFKMNGLRSGILTEMNQDLCYLQGTIIFKMNGLRAYRKLTSDWSDTTAKHLTVDQKVPGLNPTCCFAGKVVKVSNIYLP